MTPLTLPRFTDLPRWPAATADGWVAVTQRVERLARTAGDGRRLASHRVQIERLIDSGNLEAIRARLGERSFARALASVWRDDGDRARASMSPDLVLALFDAQERQPSRLLTTTLIAVFFEHFDELDEWAADLFDALAAVVHDGAKAARTRPSGQRAMNALDAVRSLGDMLLRIDSPQLVAAQIQRQGVAVNDWVSRNGMTSMQGGRWGQLLRQAVYLEEIAHCDPTDPSTLSYLRDLTDPALLQSSAAGGLHFGHEVLRAMTDRKVSVPTESWVDTLVAIGGDPRIAHTSRWRSWWQALPPQNVAVARRWMSTDDLKLFLDAVENFSMEDGNDDLRRMFPARSKFIWGLYSLGLIQETRIFMGSNAKRSVSRQIGSRYFDVAGLRSTPDHAAIYIDCGSFHLVEGSHVFKLWIYEGRPVPKLVDRSRREFSLYELRTSVPQEHAASNRFGSYGHIAIAHNGFWQRAALEFVIERLGVAIDVQQVLDDDDYRRLKMREGLPVPGSRRLR